MQSQPVGERLLRRAVAQPVGAQTAPERTLSIGLDSGTLGFLMAAGLLTVIGWAMREAAAVKAENAGFV